MYTRCDKKKPDCINHAVGTMPIGKPLAHRETQLLNSIAGVSKLFEQGAACRFFWAYSGQSQRCSLVVLPIKVFSKKKSLHLKSDSYFSIFLPKSTCSLKKRSSPKFGNYFMVMGISDIILSNCSSK